jgi:hypothetical protein
MNAFNENKHLYIYDHEFKYSHSHPFLLVRMHDLYRYDRARYFLEKEELYLSLNSDEIDEENRTLILYLAQYEAWMEENRSNEN